jgi:hypothetical protein
MQKISFIYPSDLGGLKTDENGNYLVPEGFEIYRVPTPEEAKAQRIVEIQEQIAGFESMVAPSEAELIEMGKMMHPYFQEKRKIDSLKNELEGLK